MALNRLDALNILNAIMDQTARIGLADITLDVAMISVWGTYRNRVRDAVALALQHNVRLTEPELEALGTFWVSAWKLGERERTRGMTCPLCGTKLEDEFQLCACFDKKRVGKYVEYDVPGRIAEVANQDPVGWRERTAEAFACQTCKRVFDILLGKIADKFNQGKGWKTPSYCIECATEYKEKKRLQPTQEPPPTETPALDTFEEPEQCMQ